MTIVNFGEHEETVDVVLELAADAADIFEVRGYPRERGTLLPIAVTDTRVTFRYDGLDARRRRTHLALSDRATIEQVVPGDTNDAGGSLRLRWVCGLPPGGEYEISWTAWPTEGPAASQVAGTRVADRGELFPEPPRVSADEGAAAYHAWARSTAAVATDHELFNLTITRSMADLRLLVNEGPGEGQRYVAAGVPWFTTLFRA